jgi:hypothetical protein
MEPNPPKSGSEKRRGLVAGTVAVALIGFGLTLSTAHHIILGNTLTTVGLLVLISDIAYFLLVRFRTRFPLLLRVVGIPLAIVTAIIIWLTVSYLFPPEKPLTASEIADAVVRKLPQTRLEHRATPAVPPLSKSPPAAKVLPPSPKAPAIAPKTTDKAPAPLNRSSAPNEPDAAHRQRQQRKLKPMEGDAQFRPAFRFVFDHIEAGDASFDTIEVWNDGTPIDPHYMIWQGSYIAVTRRDITPAATRYIPYYFFVKRAYKPYARNGLLVTFSSLSETGTNVTREYERLKADVRQLYESKVDMEKLLFFTIYYHEGGQKTGGAATYDLFPHLNGYEPPIPKVCPESYYKQLPMRMVRYAWELKAKDIVEGWNGFERPMEVCGKDYCNCP